MGETVDNTLRKTYFDLDSSASYAGIAKVYAHAKRKNPLITLADVKKFLTAEHTYTLHKPMKKRFPRLKTVGSGLHTDWQCDLAVFDSLRKHNDGYRYLLVCVDVISRKAFVAKVKTKKNEDIIKGFEEIFQKSKYYPWRLMSDQGTEFLGKKSQDFFKEHSIDQISLTSAPFHAGIVERMNRTIKERLYKYFNEKRTWRWIDVVDKIVKNINRSVNRSTGVAPSEVTFKNANKIYEKLYKTNSLLKKSNFLVGDSVRISKLKGIFEKGYLPNFTDEIFKIFKVHNTIPVTYTIEDLSEKIIKGRFYEQELVHTSQETLHRIEKVLRSRLRNGHKEVLVKWMGRKNLTSWIRQSKILD